MDYSLPIRAALPSSRSALTGLLLAGAILGAGCGKGDAPRWVLVEIDGALTPLDAVVSTWTGRGSQTVSFRVEEGALWMEAAIPASGWRAMEWPGVWQADRPMTSAVARANRDGVVLRKEDHIYTRNASLKGREALANLEVDSYFLMPESIVLRVAADERPPEGISFGVLEERGHRSEEGWRPTIAGFTGDGLPVWPGQEETASCDIPAGSALRFATAADPLWSAPDGEPVPRVEFRISLNDEEIFRGAEELTGAVGRWHRVVLPPAAAKGATLTFSVTGDPANTAFLAPVLGPADVGIPADRPWGTSRPSVVLFMADTFRADNMALYGGDPGTTPFLDALSERSVRFLRAWSPAAWTLPAQASMFTGLFPEQHGATAHHLGMASELTTVAEHLAGYGYRTGAITDSMFISRNYGFDQGFQYFREHKDWDLRRTLRDAGEFLAADDGRPVFLFVQTYRTHTPYRIGGDEENTALRELMEDVRAHSTEYGGDGTLSAADAARRLLGIYRDGAHALDVQLEQWFTAQEAAGRFENGYFLFTSDHGEAFLEHDEIGHGGEHWEEKIRIPLFIHGPDLAPRAVTSSATLVDVPRTIAALTRVPASEAWLGTDLLALSRDRPVFTFAVLPSERRVTLLEGERKVFAVSDAALLREGEFRAAFALGEDPGETLPLEPSDAEWAAALCRKHAALIEKYLRRAADPSTVELTEEERQHLHDIGYGGS